MDFFAVSSLERRRELRRARFLFCRRRLAAEWVMDII